MTGTQLRTWRQDRGLTVPELAGILGVSRYAVHSWESGRRPISPITERAITSIRRRQLAQRGRNAND